MVESGQEAVKQARHLRPDAITLDVMMPRGNGFETLAALKKAPETANIPIIIVSIVDQKQVGFALGAVDYLIKPVRKPVLLETIRKYVLPQSDEDEAILLVDDDPRALELLEETLRSAGYETESVRSGTRALEVLSSKIVSAVVLDLLMPGMDGFEVIRHVRQEPTLRELPIFVMTAKSLTKAELAVLTRETQALFHKNGSWQQQLDGRSGKGFPGPQAGKVGGAIMTKVLVAEDNPVNRELLRELLENRGYAVVEACDGQEALRMVDETQPDILLLDIGMPVLDGYAVARKIRENPRLTPLPILAITAYAMQGDREKILHSGFDGYLSKPVNARSPRRRTRSLAA